MEVFNMLSHYQLLLCILAICQASPSKNSLFFQLRRKGGDTQNKVTVVDPTQTNFGPEKQLESGYKYSDSKEEETYNYQFQDPSTGSYKFGYRTADQFREEERMPDGVTVGSYGWKDATGRWHNTNFVSDQNGYRVIAPGQKVNFFVSPLKTKLRYPAPLRHSVPLRHSPQKIQIPPGGASKESVENKFNSLIREEEKTDKLAQGLPPPPPPPFKIRSPPKPNANKLPNQKKAPLSKPSDTVKEPNLPFKVPVIFQPEISKIQDFNHKDKPSNLKPLTRFKFEVPGKLRTEDISFEDSEEELTDIQEGDLDDELLPPSNSKPHRRPRPKPDASRPPIGSPAPHPFFQIMKHFLAPKNRPRQPKPKPNPRPGPNVRVKSGPPDFAQTERHPSPPPKGILSLSNLLGGNQGGPPLNFLANAFLNSLIRPVLSSKRRETPPPRRRKPSLDYDLLPGELGQTEMEEFHKNSAFQSMKEFTENRRRPLNPNSPVRDTSRPQQDKKQNIPEIQNKVQSPASTPIGETSTPAKKVEQKRKRGPRPPNPQREKEVALKFLEDFLKKNNDKLSTKKKKSSPKNDIQIIE